MNKETKIINYITINGERKLFDDLSEEEKIRIGKELNIRALERAGFVPSVDKTQLVINQVG